MLEVSPERLFPVGAADTAAGSGGPSAASAPSLAEQSAEIRPTVAAIAEQADNALPLVVVGNWVSDPAVLEAAEQELRESGRPAAFTDIIETDQSSSLTDTLLEALEMRGIEQADLLAEREAFPAAVDFALTYPQLVNSVVLIVPNQEAGVEPVSDQAQALLAARNIGLTLLPVEAALNTVELEAPLGRPDPQGSIYSDAAGARPPRGGKPAGVSTVSRPDGALLPTQAGEPVADAQLPPSGPPVLASGFIIADEHNWRRYSVPPTPATAVKMQPSFANSAGESRRFATETKSGTGSSATTKLPQPAEPPPRDNFEQSSQAAAATPRVIDGLAAALNLDNHAYNRYSAHPPVNPRPAGPAAPLANIAQPARLPAAATKPPAAERKAGRQAEAEPVYDLADYQRQLDLTRLRYASFLAADPYSKTPAHEAHELDYMRALEARVENDPELRQAGLAAKKAFIAEEHERRMKEFEVLRIRHLKKLRRQRRAARLRHPVASTKHKWDTEPLYRHSWQAGAAAGTAILAISALINFFSPGEPERPRYQPPVVNLDDDGY